MSGSVLCAVDVSLPAVDTVVLEKAAKLAAMEGATLDVITVIPDFGMSVVGAFFDKTHTDQAMEEAKALGIEQSLIDFEGLSPQMMVALVKDGVKTLEDFATCADWELAGGYTVVDGQRVKDDGLLESFDVSLEEAQELVMTARLMLGWVTEEQLAEDAAAAEEGSEEAQEEAEV